MAGFFSKASSFLNSQANDQKSPSHGGKAAGSNEEKPDNSLASGGYGDLLAGAQELISSTKPSDGGSVDKHESPHKAPPSSGAGGYGDDKKKDDGVDKAADSGGYGNLLASAQEMMGSAKLGSGDNKNAVDAPKTTSSSGDPSSGDMYANAQVLMGALKANREGSAADMGEVAGATANLIGAGTRYGELDKTAYGEYAHKAQTYLEDYQASHGKASHKLPSSTDDQEKEEVGSNPPVKNPVARSGEEEYN